jgi:dTDP-4-dehydrorhamnose reductase
VTDDRTERDHGGTTVAPGRRVLVTGAAGMLARALVPVFTEAGYQLTVTDIDLSDPAPWGPYGPQLERLDVRMASWVDDAVARLHPDVVLHLAAETDLETCEEVPEHARLTNAESTRHVATACARHGAKLVYISTAGRSKLFGEHYVAELLSDYVVLRAGWMVGGPGLKDHKFVGRVIDQLRAGHKVIHAVGDKFGSPTYAPDFAATLIGLLGSTATGVLHSVSECRRSRYDVALDVVRALGRDDVEVREVSSDFFRGSFYAPRPYSEVLRNVRLREAGLNRMRPWPEPLADCLAPWMPELAGPAVLGV